MRIAPEAAWVDAADLPGSADDAPAAVYVARVPGGSPLLLEGTAWAIWTALTEASGADAAAIAARTAELIGIDVSDDVVVDIRTFLDRLAGEGLVVE